MAATAKSSAPQVSRAAAQRAERRRDVQRSRARRRRPSRCCAGRKAAPGATATWAEWDKRRARSPAACCALGLGTGERSCVLANTRPEWLHCDIGILMAGGVTVPIYQSNLAARVRVHHQRLGREGRLRREPGAAAQADGRARQAHRRRQGHLLRPRRQAREARRPGAHRADSSTTSPSPATRRG